MPSRKGRVDDKKIQYEMHSCGGNGKKRLKGKREQIMVLPSFSWELGTTSEMPSLVALCFLLLMFALLALDEAEARAAWELKQKLHISCTDNSNVCKTKIYIELHPRFFITINLFSYSFLSSDAITISPCHR